MIESQYGILLDKISSTRDYEAVKLAHDQFLSALLAQSFVHMRSVSKVNDKIELSIKCKTLKIKCLPYQNIYLYLKF